MFKALNKINGSISQIPGYLLKMFDDRFVVESAGALPGLVRFNNMRSLHFSRNPIIARYLRDYKFVRELGEGVDRMHRELLEAGLPAPEYKVVGFMTILTVKKLTQINEIEEVENWESHNVLVLTKAAI